VALSLADFLQFHPEFASAPTALVQNALDQAGRRTPAEIWGDKADDRQGWMAAYILDQSPFSRSAVSSADSAADGTYAPSRYGRVLARMDLEQGPGVAPRVT
jgi:hypothetical protein